MGRVSRSRLSRSTLHLFQKKQRLRPRSVSFTGGGHFTTTGHAPRLSCGYHDTRVPVRWSAPTTFAARVLKMDTSHDDLKSLTSLLKQAETALLQLGAKKKARTSSLQDLHTHTRRVHNWRRDPVPLSKQDIVHEMSHRLFPIMQSLVDVIEEQQSRIQVLEHHVLNQVNP